MGTMTMTITLHETDDFDLAEQQGVITQVLIDAEENGDIEFPFSLQVKEGGITR